MYVNTKTGQVFQVLGSNRRYIRIYSPQTGNYSKMSVRLFNRAIKKGIFREEGDPPINFVYVIAPIAPPKGNYGLRAHLTYTSAENELKQFGDMRVHFTIKTVPIIGGGLK